MTIPLLNRDQSRLVDKIAVDRYGMSSLVLMENAGRGLADLLCERQPVGQVVICCGKGNNAGDGFVLARHLALRGVAVRVLVWGQPEELSPDAAANYQILSHTDTPIVSFSSTPMAEEIAAHTSGADWIVDAFVGTGAKGGLRSPFDAAVEFLNQQPGKKLAIDVPSGLDCDTGVAAEPTFRADHTATFVAAKPGLVAEVSRPWVGELHVLDIGAPAKVIDDAKREMSSD